MEQVAKHIVFTGQVQGVGFRFTALHIANRCHLTGYVRNRPDSAVEMLAQGPAELIDDCIRDIEESFAEYIREIDVQPATLDPNLSDFRITF